MALTTSEEKQVHHVLSVLSNLRHALSDYKDVRSSRGWSGSSTARKKLARAARKFQQAVLAEGWNNQGRSLDQSAGHLMGRVEVCADAEKKFVPEFAADTLDKIEDFEQALQSRLEGPPSMFPITASDLTRRAGLKNVPSVTKQLGRAINKDRKRRGKAHLAKRPRGKVATYREPELRQAYPYLREGSPLKELIASALEIKWGCVVSGPGK